jgi:hypothetical protein
MAKLAADLVYGNPGPVFEFETSSLIVHMVPEVFCMFPSDFVRLMVRICRRISKGIPAKDACGGFALIMIRPEGVASPNREWQE